MKSVLVLAACALGLAMPGIAQAASISGTVTDAASHASIGDVEAVLYDSDGSYLDDKLTAADGGYTFTNLEAGTYTVGFSSSSAGVYARQFYNDQSSYSAADPIVLQSATAAQHVDAGLHIGGQIAGTVTDAGSRAPLADIIAVVYDADSGYESDATTDASGHYAVSGLTPGNYTVVFYPATNDANYITQYYNRHRAFGDADLITVTNGSVASGVDAALDRGGQIKGLVTDAQTHEALSGVEVDVFGSNEDDGDGWAVTDETGHYVVAGLATGNYRVGFYTYYGGGGYRTQYYDDKTSLEDANPVAVSEGSDTEQIDADLDPKGQITGTVTDSGSGGPVAGIYVEVYDSSGSYESYVRTDASGKYRVLGLDPGSYKVQFFDDDGSGYRSEFYNDHTTLDSADSITVTDRGVTQGINASLAKAGTITGTVTDATTHGPVAGVFVTAYSSVGFYEGTAITDANGQYTTSGLEAGSYRVDFQPDNQTNSSNYRSEYYDNQRSSDAADPIAVTFGQQTAGIDAALEAGGQIDGTVIDAATHQPVAGVLVQAYGSDDNEVATAFTDASGHYVLSGLDPGDYKVGFLPASSGLDYLTQYNDGASTLDDADPVTVTVGQSAHLSDAQLRAAGTISGRVTAASTGEPIWGVWVSVYDSTSGYSATAFTGDDGDYAIHGLPTGTYTVAFYPFFAGTQYTQQYYHGRQRADADPVHVNAGSPTSGIDASLQSAGTISGTVTDASTGTPLSGIPVTAYRPDLSSVSVHSDAAGQYSLTGLATGTYRVAFSSSMYGGFPSQDGDYAPQYYDTKTSFTDADPVQVNAGTTTSGIDGALTRGGQISGTVTDSVSGDAVSHMYVYVYQADGSYFISGQTDSTGHYTVGGLATGDYTVQFAPDDQTNYIGVYYHSKTYTDADPVHVTLDEMTSGIDQQVQRGARITGTVLDSETHDPIAGVNVNANGYLGTLFGYGNATTDASGHYVVNGLATGSYALAFYDGSGHHLPKYSDGQVDVTAGEDATAPDTELDPAGNVSGTVTDIDDGSPVRDSIVTLYSDAGYYQQRTTTDSLGRYTFIAASPGQYKVSFHGGDDRDYGTEYYDGKSAYELADPITVPKRATTTNIDGHLTVRPAISLPPAINGAAKQGQTLTMTAGQWSHHPTSIVTQWLRCRVDEDYCSSITGANSSTYTVGESDIGYRLAVQEVATNAGGEGDPARSEFTAPVVPLPPVSVKAPSITGYAQQGQVMSAVHGTWTNSPTDFHEQWLVCNGLGSGCSAISGATGSTYTPVESDIGHRIVLQETAVNAGGESDPTTSTASAMVVRAVPANLTLPTIAGTAKQGQTLTEGHGQWTGEPNAFKYQWYRCDTAGASCQAISGETSPSYVARAADVDHTLEVNETASNDGGPSAPAASVHTDVVTATRPVNISPPSISGLAKQGATLTGYPGSWNFEPSSYAYKWLACPENGDPCQAIAGATDSTFTPSAAEVGDELILQVVATNPAGASLPASSAPTDPVIPPVPTNSSLPTISGNAVQGQTLNAIHGAWTNNPTSYSLQWKRCSIGVLSCQVISGETSSAYVLTAADIGARIVVTEQASNADGDGAPVTSAPTGAVVAGPPTNVTVPTVTGTAREGKTLTAQHGDWTNSPSSYDFQWLACSSIGVACAAIDGETGSSYAVRSGDVGNTIAVEVTATNAGGTSQPARSAATDVVTASDLPDTTITDAPPVITRADTQVISFGSDAIGVTFECQLGTAGFGPCTSPKVYAGLAEGHYEFEVRAKDSAGRLDPSPASTTWTIDRTAPETTITSGPAGAVHTSVSFAFASPDPGTFECATDNGQFRVCHSGAPVSLSGVSPGEHTFRVRATDLAGNVDASSASQSFTVVNAAPTTTLDVTPDSGAAALDIHATIDASDGDGDALGYKIDFGDGHIANGLLPQDTIAHTYTQVGVYLVRLEVDDDHEAVVVTKQVTVVLAEPLRADAGDDLGAVVGEAVHLDGRGSRPTAGIESLMWTFGDGATGNGAQATHTYTSPGTYTATLTVTAGGHSESDSAQVHVVAADVAEGLGVTVTSGGGPVADADVLVITPGGQRVSGVSDAAGRTRLHGLADGTFTVLTYVPGYLPMSTPAIVSSGSGTVSVSLTAGNVAEATLTHRRLDRQEIEDLGIDPDNPANQVVTEFNVHLNDATFTGHANANGFIGSGCSNTVCYVTSGGFGTYIRYGSGGGGSADAPTLSTFTLPVRARWLKEFFSVEMSIYNLGTQDFALTNGRARLSLPSGLSLAPTARGEQLTRSVGDIAGGDHATVDWIVRGDDSGEYNLAADYAATLDPVGASISLRAQTDTPLKVWGANAIQPIVETDDEHRDGYPMQVRVGLKNVADIPVYDAEVSLDDGGVGYLDEPRQRASRGAQEIPAGQTAWLGPWIIIPDSSGTIDPAASFVEHVRGADLGSAEIRTRTRVPALDDTPKLDAKHLGDAIELDWAPVAGATGYEIYEIPDRHTPFDSQPIDADLLDSTSAVINEVPADGEHPYYAVSAIVGGEHTMVHPLEEAPDPPPAGEGDEDPAGPPKGECGLTSVKLGSAELLASCFTKDGDIYTAAGRVRVNGIDLFPKAASVVVDLHTGKITIDNVTIKLGNVVLYKGRFEWNPKIDKTFELPEGTTVGKMPLEGSLTIKVEPTRAELDGSVKLPYANSGVVGELKLVATNDDGPKIDEFEIKFNGLSLPGRIGIDGGLLHYKRTSAGDQWTGSATVAIPRGPSSMKLTGELTLLNGKFKAASIEADEINQYIAYGVFLQRLKGGIELDPLALSGGIAFSAGPSIDGTALLRVDGDVRLSFGDPQEYSVDGSLKILDATIESGHVSYNTDGLFEFSGEVGFEHGDFKAKAGVEGWVDGTRAANARGYGEFSVPGVSFSAEGVVSSVGIAACRHGVGPDVGAGYRWSGHDLTIFASSCDIGPYEAQRSLSTHAPDSFTVDQDQSVQVLAFHGDGAAPRVVLTGPDGQQITAPDNGRGIDQSDLMLIQYPSRQTTYVAIYKPEPGQWSVATAPGSAAVTAIERAGPLPEPRVKANVTESNGHGALSWSLLPIPGQTVQFVERSAHGARVIATTNAATGSAAFDATPDTTAERKIVAIVEQNGLSRREIELSTFQTDPTTPVVVPVPPGTGPAVVPGAMPAAGAPTSTYPAVKPAVHSSRPQRVARVRVARRRGGVVVITWPSARRASRYAVEARFRGRRVKAVQARRRLVLHGVRRVDRIRISVRAIAKDGTRAKALVVTNKAPR